MANRWAKVSFGVLIFLSAKWTMVDVKVRKPTITIKEVTIGIPENIVLPNSGQTSWSGNKNNIEAIPHMGLNAIIKPLANNKNVDISNVMFEFENGYDGLTFNKIIWIVKIVASNKINIFGG